MLRSGTLFLEHGAQTNVVTDPKLAGEHRTLADAVVEFETTPIAKGALVRRGVSRPKEYSDAGCTLCQIARDVQ